MNKYIIPKKRNIKQIQDKYSEQKIKFKDYMANKKLTTYPELKESVVNNYVRYADNINKTNKEEIQTRL